MNFKKKSLLALSIIDPISIAYFLIGGYGVIFATLTFSSKSLENTFFLGLSVSRFILVIFITILSIFFFIFSTKWGAETKLSRSIKSLFQKHSQTMVFIFLWIALLLFVFQFEGFFGLIIKFFPMLDSALFFQRFKPLLLWGFLTNLTLGLAEFFNDYNSFKNIPNENRILFTTLFFRVRNCIANQSNPKKKYRERPIHSINYLGLVTWFGFIFVFLLMYITKLGVNPDDRFWNAAGVPILFQQLVLIILLSLFLLDVNQITFKKYFDKTTKKKLINILTIIFIWMVAYTFWQQTQLKHTYFAPGPYPPNYEHYPFSDASRFDIGGQYYLMGKGLNQNLLTDRPFMMLYMVFLHLIVGQQYEHLINAQLVFLAFIPVFLYLIGQKLHSKTAGVIISLLCILKERNAILTGYNAGIINPKVFMSELPNALLLSMAAYFVISWLINDKKLLIWPVLSGGVIGLAVGVRGNSLAIFPLILLIIGIQYLSQKQDSRYLIRSTMVFIIGFSVVLFPYSLYTYKNFGASFLMEKIEFIVNRSADDGAKSNNPAKSYKIIATLDNHSKPDPLAINTSADIPLSENIFSFSLIHFLNNEARTIMIYPLDFHVTSLDETVEKPFWDPQSIWTEVMSPSEIVILIGYLLIISLGISFSFRHWKWAGLVPLLFHLTYNGANSIARTSGGRYIVPTDWVIHIYLMLGFLFIVYKIFSWEFTVTKPQMIKTETSQNYIFAIVLLLSFTLIGYSYAFSPLFTPPYSLENPEQYITQDQQEIITSNFCSEGAANKLLASKNGFMQIGMVLYPRYFRQGDNMERSSYIPNMPDDQSRLYFLFLTDEGPQHINIVQDQRIPKITNASYGIVIGIKQNNYIDGKIFIPLDETQTENIILSSNKNICP